MELTDIAPLEDWIQLEKNVSRHTGMNAAVFNADGMRVTDFVFWANHLCPRIKSHEKGQKFICAVAHQNLAARAARSGKAVIDACDAGMIKLVVPVMVGGDFIGVAGGCGSLETGEEIDPFLIHKTIGMPEDQIERLADDIRVISRLQAEAYAEFVEEQIQLLVSCFTHSNVMTA